MFTKKSSNDDHDHLTFMDFLNVLAHTYHSYGHPAPSWWTIWDGAFITGLIVWGIHKLCS